MSRYSEETLDALLKSAERWRDGLGTHHNGPLCSLHRKIIVDEDGNETVCCFGCPIREKTGWHGCQNTPYVDFFDTDDKARYFSKWLFKLYEEVK